MALKEKGSKDNLEHVSSLILDWWTNARKLIPLLSTACFLKNKFSYIFNIVMQLILWCSSTFFTIVKNLLLPLNSCSQGLVVVWELNQERRGKPERIYVSSEHKGRKVTALCWDTAILRVFVGDHMGKVSAIKLNTSKQVKVRTSLVLCV